MKAANGAMKYSERSIRLEAETIVGVINNSGSMFCSPLVHRENCTLNHFSYTCRTCQTSNILDCYSSTGLYWACVCAFVYFTVYVCVF